MKPTWRHLAALCGLLGVVVVSGIWFSAPQARSAGLAAPAATPSGTPIHFPIIMRQGPTTATPTPTATPLPVTPPASGDWRTYLAYYRASARLPALAENTNWSAEAAAYAQSIVESDSFAGANGPYYIIVAQGSPAVTDRQALDTFMQWPFHALGIIDPQLQSTGFGSYRSLTDTPTLWDMAAVLDVVRGAGPVPPGTSFPIMWPGHNSNIYLTSYDGNEQPNPLTSCPGFGMTSGLPIILQLGSGSVTPEVTAYSLRENGVLRSNLCVFNETNYINSIADLQAQGRDALNARDAVVLIPREPLVAGRNYTVSITANGQTYQWSFGVTSPP